MDKYKKYHEAADFMEHLNRLSDDVWPVRSVDWQLRRDRTKYLLKLIGNPQDNFKIIHITGTAGKGTVANMIHGMLVASGKKAGLLTSPRVSANIERIKVGELYISPDQYTNLVDRLKPAIKKAYKSPFGGPSHAIAYFALALEYFRQQKCEWVILEAGAGGRRDYTNVIKSPVVSVITNIGHDHMKILGNTLAKIADDKAGIIKKGSIFWTAEQRPRLVKFFQDVCVRQGAAFNQVPHQKDKQSYNAELVRGIGRSLGIKEEFIFEGIKNAKLPARFEIIQESPLVIIDMAHSKSKMSDTADKLKKLKYQKLHLVIALASTKNKKDILPKIIPFADYVYCTSFKAPNRKCAPPEDLAQVAKKYKKGGAKIKIVDDSRQALDEAIKNASKNDAILVTGSVFLAGDLRQRWYPEEYILKKRKSF